MSEVVPPKVPSPPAFTVKDALIICGIFNANGVAAVDRRSNVDRVSDEMFDNQFENFKDITYKDLMKLQTNNS